MTTADREKPIDREKVCPFLLRCFWKLDGHHALHEYSQVAKGVYPGNEMQIYTWPDCTLRELVDLIQDANPAARGARARFGFALVFPDKSGRNVLKEIGQLSSKRQGPQDVDGDRTLRNLRFETGDYLDVAIYKGPEGRQSGRS